MAINDTNNTIPAEHRLASGRNYSSYLEDFREFNPQEDAQVVATAATGTAKADAVNAVLTTPTVDGVLYSVLNKRQIVTTAFAITGAALHAANLTAVTFPAAAIILRAVLDVTTKSTGAATVDIGYATVSATTASDTLLDGIDVGTAAALFDSMNAALDTGTNAFAQKAVSGKFVTVHENADTTGMVAILYVEYILT